MLEENHCVAARSRAKNSRANSFLPENEECPDAFRHPGYYEKFIYACNETHYILPFLFVIIIQWEYEQNMNEM